MCGIIGEFNSTKNKKKIRMANDGIIETYQDQYGRGQEGFGILRIDKKLGIQIDRACEPTKFMLDLYTKKSPMIIAHHRTPTSTDNWLDQTHPFFIEHPSLKDVYYGVHNGMISNTDTLHKKHIELGYEYTSEYVTGYTGYERQKWNDSESLIIELAMFIEGKAEKVDTLGSAAFIVVQADGITGRAKRIFFGRHTSPLNIFRDKDIITLSSTGEGEEVKENILYSFDPKQLDAPLEEKPITFATAVVSTYTQSSFSHSHWNGKEHVKTVKEVMDEAAATHTPTTTAITTVTPKQENPEKKAWREWQEENLNLFKRSIDLASKQDIALKLNEALEDDLELMTMSVQEHIENLNDASANSEDLPKFGSLINDLVPVLKLMEQKADAARTEYLIAGDDNDILPPKKEPLGFRTNKEEEAAALADIEDYNPRMQDFQ